MICVVFGVAFLVLLLAAPALPQDWGELATPVSPVNLRQSLGNGKALAKALAEGIDGPVPAAQQPQAQEEIEGKPKPPLLASAAAPAFAITAPPPAKAQATSRTTEHPLALASPFIQRNPEVPSGDKTLHGFRYAVLDIDEERVNGVSVVEIKVYLDVTTLPEREAIKDFATSIWKEKRPGGRELVVDVFLPDTDLKGLPYAVARYDDNGPQEYFTRKTILFGTRFAR